MTAPVSHAASTGTAPPRNVLEALQRATAYLDRKSIPSARLEGEVLLSFVLGRPRVALYTGFDQPLAADEIDRYRVLLQRRAGGEPTAYIVGEKEFWSLLLKVDARVLIPRPDTERLVEAALVLAKELGAQANAAPLQILEIGPGSGAISIALATELRSAALVAIDLSKDALAVASENAVRHDVCARIELRHGDLYAPLHDDERFHLIVSNPPYIRHLDVPKLQAEVAYFEPRLALDGGGDGLEVVRRLIAGARSRLLGGGALLCEIGHDQGDVVRALAAAAGMERIEVLRDLGGHERTLSARAPLTDASASAGEG